MAAPVLLVVLVHDIGKLLLRQTSLQGQAFDNAEVGVWLLAAGSVFFVRRKSSDGSSTQSR